MMRKIILPLIVLALVSMSCKKDNATVTVSTQAVTNNEGNKVTLNGTITGESTNRGFVYSTSSGPTIDNGLQTVASNSSGDVISATVFVDPNSTYYVRAYAYSDDEPVYGNEVSFVTGYAIGQDHDGGVIGYFFESGDLGYVSGEQHGLIMAKDILGSSIPWGCEGTSIPTAIEQAIGYGQANTAAILSGCSDPGTAAKLCNDLVVDSFSDWYLPSYEELRAIDENYEKIDDLTGNGGFYFSSSQASATNAWAIYIWPPPSVTAPQEYAKSSGRRVMAVRTF